MHESRDPRRSDRQPIEVPVQLRLLSGALAGLTDNLSSVGVLLTTEQPLRVEVELEVDGERLVKQGRLIRYEPLDPRTAGVAIEFDD